MYELKIMGATTNIQWCHSTVNPVMGCDGCELWPSRAQVAAELATELISTAGGFSQAEAITLTSRIVGDADMSQIYRSRESLAYQIQCAAGLTVGDTGRFVDVIRRSAKCYAGMLGTNRGGHKGYADQFEEPKLFPGRMAKAASLGLPTAAEEAAKPWLAGCRRLIFVSDMGDALSAGIAFDYLRTEILATVSSDEGRRHLWLWLTKRPGRMAQFGNWLEGQGVLWPENLVAMTTITSREHAGRIDQLRKVPSRLKGLSLEPLFGPVDFSLQGVDWVIVGGGSDVLAEPFHIEWALEVQKTCAEFSIAFFLKQLGRRPYYAGAPIKLANPHGGDWAEWQMEWRLRRVPVAFRRER